MGVRYFTVPAQVTVLPNEAVFDPTISLPAKGLLLMLVATDKWPSWTVERLRAEYADTDAFDHWLEELQNAGYLTTKEQ